MCVQYVCVYPSVFSFCGFSFLCINVDADFMFSTAPLIHDFVYIHTLLSRPEGMDGHTHTLSHTLSTPSSLNRGVSDPPSFLYSQNSRAKEIFLSLFFPLKTFFSLFFPLLLFLFSESAALVLALIPPTTLQSTPPNPPRASSQLTGAVS